MTTLFRIKRNKTGAWTYQSLIFFMALSSFSGCRAIKPYEKEHLLNPIMDDARVERLSAPYSKSVRRNERLANVGSAGSGSTSCPTCGG